MQPPLYGLFGGAVAALLHGLFGLVHWYSWEAYLLIGLFISIAGWLGDLLWRTTVETSSGHPASSLAVLSRIPFWFLAGGIGYALGMILSKKLFLLGFYDKPMRPIFILGGIIGVAIQIPRIFFSLKITSNNAAITRTE